MASDLKLDLVMRASQQGPNVQLMGNPAVDLLVAIGVLSSVRYTEWGLPTFITPQKGWRSKMGF